VSVAKMKQHEECGLTLSIKNLFGITPDSIYGDDAGIDEPNEKGLNGREEFCTLASGSRRKGRQPRSTLHPTGTKVTASRTSS
jgi:hypothetical protein